MKTYGFEIVEAEYIKQYISRHLEEDYVIIDVRQPQEYLQEHIPGALLIPLPELEAKQSGLPKDKDFIFYCKSGGRSQMAAMMTAESKVTDRNIYNLKGGIMAWNDMTLDGFPKVKAFDRAKTLPEFLLLAMDMEKGADRFYREISRRYPDKAFAAVFENLAAVETAHAKLIYGFYKKHAEPEPASFEAFYASLDGNIIEGGESLESGLAVLDTLKDTSCQDVMDLALEMEFTAFDLYRTLANQTTHDPTLSGAFLDIAQAEKSHMRIISDALSEC
ncbi:MAG: rhodanese-like domain-containing protein [Desulfosalsimonadaceae bacterium]